MSRSPIQRLDLFIWAVPQLNGSTYIIRLDIFIWADPQFNGSTYLFGQIPNGQGEFLFGQVPTQWLDIFYSAADLY
jgi:hypothetical protein